MQIFLLLFAQVLKYLTSVLSDADPIQSRVGAQIQFAILTAVDRQKNK